jgi:hypothetical protein
LSACPKCGAAYNGEEVCTSCGVIPAKYLERQRVEQEIETIPEEENKGNRQARRIAFLLVIGFFLTTTAYLLRNNFRDEISDWIDSRNAPNFELSPDEFPTQSQSDIIREYNDRGYTLHCYGNLQPEEKASDSDDYVCWIPIRSAYNNIPAQKVAFFFSEEKVNHVRLDFADSSFKQVQQFLQKKMINQQRLDLLPQYSTRTDTFGEPVMIWDIEDGVLQTSAKPTPGRFFIVLWSRKK